MNLINELRMLAEDLHVNGYNRYSAAMSKAADELERLAAKLEAAEKEQDALRTELNEIRYGVAVAHDTIKALRAKIEGMEQQEPIWFIDERGKPKRYHKSKADYCKYGGLDLLYALPGAKGVPKC